MKQPLSGRHRRHRASAASRGRVLARVGDDPRRLGGPPEPRTARAIGVSRAALSNATAASAWAFRSRARWATASSNVAISSSGPSAAAARCHARSAVVAFGERVCERAVRRPPF